MRTFISSFSFDSDSAIYASDRHFKSEPVHPIEGLKDIYGTEVTVPVQSLVLVWIDHGKSKSEW
jgi:hypothetical protein